MRWLLGLLCISCTALLPYNQHYVIVADKVKTPLDSEIGSKYLLVLTDGKRTKIAMCSKEFYTKTNRYDTLYNMQLRE
jgi:hypothetical protein